ncbi:iron-containing alcohol dehydrogenase [Stutzerimonas frequens]|uniref:iron-containing alcohol dehydrogenase n=1 Tax=Stutzerimonas frequens TaxID=2968969 RepID=UPI0007B7BFF1|nr:iron-containing alcohol dehydrogenase [Stutzerimonas frequens]NCT78573.1 iron-containing alcohol dehydrogenase [Stutzerimonas stutzeri]KZX65243.1 alcohol dehydrogenase [Stutzerimonas frequens]MBK3873336.1 iron-containing alcohol dehydrogenase [Stutzerimonas frequens]MBK3911605.1 iron-containing alcohol dehydrogenase [Stutzerimonas frequens]MBK3930888.1 iron-containing alcohol dehydrogenase [Stutzerimonas frequens]
MSHRIVLPRLMEVGAGASGQLARVLQELGCSRPLIVTDRMMVELGYVARIAGQLEEAGIASQCFADTLPEPTAASIRAGVEMVRQGDFDSIVALGGGSPIDSAKAIGILGKFGGEMRDYRFPRDVSEAGLPLIAIPTTAGTGSEATRFTIITDETSDEKMLCAGLGFMPIAALIDYELTLSLPPRVTADTGIDALTHAIEAYVSRKASLYSDSQALEAMRLLAPNLRAAFHQPDDRAAREAMMLGATLAGIAFSNASVALVHGMSRPIGAFFHVPHGLSNAMLLPAITAFSIPAAPERYADCARAMGVATQTDSVEVANDKLLAELRAINQELKVPSPEQFGIARERFFELRATMARQALASGSPGNNPRVPTEAEIIDLYETVWNQE